MKRQITVQNDFSVKKFKNENKSVDSSDIIIQGQDDITNNPGGYGWVPKDQPHTLLWVPCNSGDPLPRGAVHAGTDKDGEPLYAGRAFYEGDLLPAKKNPSHSSAYVCWGGKEHAMSHYEVLCHANVAWQTAQGNHIPPNAIVIGSTVDGEKLYMGRTLHDGTLTPGKIHPSHGTLYIPYNGEEVSYTEYEVMIYIPTTDDL